jgi:hypothetical protein
VYKIVKRKSLRTQSLNTLKSHYISHNRHYSSKENIKDRNTNSFFIETDECWYLFFSFSFSL